MIDNPRMLQCKTSVSTRRARPVARRHRGRGVIAASLGVAALFTLGACGQKGPLIAPKPAATASAPAAK
jgi:predicted small lipoprotein YifL